MSTRWSSRLKLSTHHSRFKQKQGLQLPRNQYSRNFLTVNPLESALPRTAPTTPAESTLTKPHESVSKQTTLTLAECALTSFSTSLSKQRTSSLIESTLTRFVTLTPLESALTKKVGGEGSNPIRLACRTFAEKGSPDGAPTGDRRTVKFFRFQPIKS